MSAQQGVHGSEAKPKETAELLESRIERTVKEEVEVVVRRMEGDDEVRLGLEDISERVAKRVLEPVFESLEDGSAARTETIESLFNLDG